MRPAARSPAGATRRPALLLAACGDPGSAGAPSDAAVDAIEWTGGCWPIETASPGGSMTMDIGEEVPVVFTGSGAFGVTVRVLESGFDPPDVVEATKPRTRFGIYFADSNLPLVQPPVCPSRYAYENGAASFDVFFAACWGSKDFVGKQVRIDGELLDWNGTTYAHTTRTITLTPPPGSYPETSSQADCP